MICKRSPHGRWTQAYAVFHDMLRRGFIVQTDDGDVAITPEGRELAAKAEAAK